MYSQKKYYLHCKKYVHQQQQQSPRSQHPKASETKKKHRRKYKRCHSRYVSTGSFGGSFAFELYSNPISPPVQQSSHDDEEEEEEEEQQEEAESSHSGSVLIKEIEIIEEHENDTHNIHSNGYQALSQQTPNADADEDEDEDYDQDEEEVDYELANLAYLPLDETAVALPFELEPLKINDVKDSDEEDLEIDTKVIDRILLQNQIANDGKANLDDKGKHNESDAQIVQKESNAECTGKKRNVGEEKQRVYDSRDIWSFIEESEENSKMAVEASTLETLMDIFDCAEYIVWDRLLEFYQEFKSRSECDQYYICRHKLRASQKTYIQQKNHQKIYTPRNRKSLFWQNTKSTHKADENDPFKYKYTNVHTPIETDEIQIVDSIDM